MAARVRCDGSSDDSDDTSGIPRRRRLSESPAATVPSFHSAVAGSPAALRLTAAAPRRLGCQPR